MGIVKEVECSIDDFNDLELIDEICWRGLEDEFFDHKYVKNFSDEQLIDALEDRGYYVMEKKADPIPGLFSTYLTMSPQYFQKELIKFFKSYGLNP